MTKTVLHIDSSALYEGSVSRQFTKDIVAKLGADKVIERDLAKGTDLIDTVWVGANFTPKEDRTDAQKARLAESDALIAELREADTIVIGVATYNFNVAGALKLWIDQIARVGETFQYTENGPVGLLEGKKAIVVITSGGVPAGSPIDFTTPYMKHILGFIGITDVEIIAADRTMARGEGIFEELKDDVAKAVA